MQEIDQAADDGNAVRVMLVGVSRMLSDIIGLAIENEPDIVVVENTLTPDEDLGPLVRRKNVDVVIYSAASSVVDAARIDDLLHTNPRLGLLEVMGERNGGTLHHLVSAHDEIGQLTQTGLAAAIRAGAALRRR
jgi:hypothetical protein